MLWCRWMLVLYWPYLGHHHHFPWPIFFASHIFSLQFAVLFLKVVFVNERGKWTWFLVQSSIPCDVAGVFAGKGIGGWKIEDFHFRVPLPWNEPKICPLKRAGPPRRNIVFQPPFWRRELLLVVFRGVFSFCQEVKTLQDEHLVEKVGQMG